MEKLNTLCKSTTTLDLQTVILVSFSAFLSEHMKSLFTSRNRSFYIVLLVLYWPAELSLIVKT